MYNDTLIYDVGAHSGEDTEFYLSKGFTVVAVEAVPDFACALKDKFRDAVNRGTLVVANVAIAEKSGQMIDFYIDKRVSVWGTANLDWVERNRTFGAGDVRQIQVPTSTLSDLFDAYGVPRYCKIDIEGNDLVALKSLLGSATIPKFISIESNKSDWNGLLEEFDVLLQLGYSKFKAVDQTLVDRHHCPNPSLELEYVERTFSEGSSGLFGEEIPGSWLDSADIIELYKHIFRGYALNGDNGLFSRRFGILNLIRMSDKTVGRLRGWKNYSDPVKLLPRAGWYDTHATW